MIKRALWMAIVPVLMSAALITVAVGCAGGATPTEAPSKAAPASVATPTSQAKPASQAAPQTQPSASQTTPAAKAAAPVSFAGKTVTVVVPTDAGGSADRIGRLYAKYLPKFLPGSPNVIVRNMPGGNTIIAANFFYGSKTDGLTLYTSPSSTALEDLLGNKALKFSLRELTAVAAPPASTNVVFVRPEVIEKPEDILKAQRLIWGQGAGSSTSFLLAAEMIGIPVAKAVFSWSGQADAFRAFLAGETNISSVSSTGFDAQVKPFVERGEAKLLMQSGMIDETGSVIRHPSFPNLMTVVDLGEKVNGKAPSGMAFDVFKAIAASLDSMKQILFLPPNTPDSIVQAYWDSADKMVKDPDFLKESSALTDAGDTWRAGKAFDQMFHKSYGMKPEASEWLKNTMQTKYGLVLQ